MTDTTLDQKGEAGASRWVKGTLAVTFCIALIAALGVVFTRVIAARVPEQRATLEKLIADRTGLQVRFDNVHFAWALDGTSAVFTRVELTDPVAGRVRVVAPELRVEFDAWDFLRHHQFSLGHVTLSSPDIEIIGDPDESIIKVVSAPRGKATRVSAPGARADEAALVRSYLAWAELMPNGRIEVEGARVHLMRRGDRAAHRSFTLSEAVVSRGSAGFNAYGTMLLAQDVGQSLFVSASLQGLGAGAGVSGDLRVIARRVFLDKLSLPGLNGRGTVDAKLRLAGGRIDSGSWQASARELELGAGARFDHVSLSGTLARDSEDLLLDFTNLQLTRGARLERAPIINARLSLEPGSTRIARTTMRAERVPFMAMEFIAGLLAPQLASAVPAAPGGWAPVAGEMHDLRFDSGARRTSPDAWVFSARIAGAELTRVADHASLAQLSAQVRLDAHELQLSFEDPAPATLQLGGAHEARSLMLSGRLALVTDANAPRWRFESFAARSGAGSVGVDGTWNDFAANAVPVTLKLSNVDHQLLQDARTIFAPDAGDSALLAEIEHGEIVDGTLRLLPGERGQSVNWQRSSGTLALAQLASSGKQAPRLSAGRGALSFARGAAQLNLESGNLEDLQIAAARLDWPRSGAPRLQAALNGNLSSSVLRGVLRQQGLDRLSGGVSLDVDARGENELRDPALWRVSARLKDASVPLAGGLPPLEKLAGTIRYSARQLRSLALEGSWLGGPVEIDARRASARGAVNLGVSGTADAAPLLRLLGQGEAANRVDGQLAWTGTAQLGVDDGLWQVTLASNLGGVESRLPEPFGKPRTRQLPVNAQLHVGADGIRDFEVSSGHDLLVRGQVRGDLTAVHFEVLGVAGELRHSGDSAAQVEIGRLDLKRAPLVLAAAGALLPMDTDLSVTINDMRYADSSLGALEAAIARHEGGVRFSAESSGNTLHQLTARGECVANEGRCRADFSADTSHLAALLHGAQLPAEWPREALHAAGKLEWPIGLDDDFTRSLAGTFELETQGVDNEHQLSADATVADGQILLANVQGTGPAPDQIFRGSGRVGLLTRDYDLTVDFEKVSLAATAMPSPARARFARALSLLRGSVARRGWTDAPETKRVQWHGAWD